jgi:hypothetical protein
MSEIEGIEKKLRWGLRSHHLAEGTKVYVTCVFNSEKEPQAEINWNSTDFNFQGGYKIMVNRTIIHAEQVFTGEETDKLRLRVRAIDRNLYKEDIESILKSSLDELKYTHRGSLKGKKFGL